jgi:hypothetical protein
VHCSYLEFLNNFLGSYLTHYTTIVDGDTNLW